MLRRATPSLAEGLASPLERELEAESANGNIGCSQVSERSLSSVADTIRNVGPFLGHIEAGVLGRKGLMGLDVWTLPRVSRPLRHF